MPAELHKGKPCVKHPGALRYKSNYNCVKCNAEQKQKWYGENPQYVTDCAASRREFYYKNRSSEQARSRKIMNEFKAELKNAVVNVLTNGEGTCRWCGQGDQDVLTIDHINNDGARHRRELKSANIYRWLVQNDYPPGFQVLCFNCNVKKEVMRRRSLRKEAH